MSPVTCHGIAVVGTGYIGGEHMRAIAASPRARLEVICSTERSRGAAEELRSTHGAGRTTTDYEDVLSDDRVDVVYLCTPNSRTRPRPWPPWRRASTSSSRSPWR